MISAPTPSIAAVHLHHEADPVVLQPSITHASHSGRSGRGDRGDLRDLRELAGRRVRAGDAPDVVVEVEVRVLEPHGWWN